MKARDKNLARDPDFYRNMGRKGGKASSTGGFASLAVGDDGLTGPERAKIAGARGGRISRRYAAEKETVKTPLQIAVDRSDNSEQRVEVRVASKRSAFAAIRRMFS